MRRATGPLKEDRDRFSLFVIQFVRPAVEDSCNTPLSIRDWFARPSTGRTLRISLRCTAYNQRVSATEQLKERVSVEDQPAQHGGCENEELW